MHYTMKTPCDSCPFRSDFNFPLHAARAVQIVQALTREGKTFACHKTTHGRAVVEQHCAGALIMLERECAPNQMMRIAGRLGMYDRAGLDMDAPVFTPRQMLAHYDAQEG